MSKKKKNKKKVNNKRRNSNSSARHIQNNKKKKAVKKSVYRPEGAKKSTKSSKPKVKAPKVKKPKSRRFKTAVRNIFSKLKKTPKRIVITILSIALVVAVALVINSGVLNSYEIPQVALQDYAGVNEDEKRIRDIDIGIKEQHERADELKIKGDKDAFKFFARKELLFDEWDREAPFTFGNVSTNECILIVTLLDEDDNMIYRSKGLEPGKYIPRIKLFNEMPYGTYDVNMVVVAYDAQTRERIGTQYTQVRMVIGIEYNQEEQTETTAEQ